MSYSEYPHGFAHGLTVRDIPVNMAINPKANVFWVDSVNGSNYNKGTFTRPFATLAFAVTQCVASQGDIIYLAAGHAESVVAASGVLFNIAGMTVIFLGEGTNRARLTFSTLVSAGITISAANVTLVNPYFVTNIDALTSPITITGANCQIVNGEWHDAAAKAATDCIITSAAATGLKINGWKYFASTTGTQKNSQIRLLGVNDAVLSNIDIAGDFIVGNVNNLTTACLNLRLEDVKLKNTNATPKPGIVLQANTTGMAKNVDIRIVSGIVFVSSVAKMNWDDNCLGYNADGENGDLIGTGGSGSINSIVTNIQTEVSGTYDSSAFAPGADGNVFERLDFIQAALASPQGDLYRIGACDVAMVASTTNIVCLDIAGAGDDVFNNKYYMQILRNDNAHGVAPETELRLITDYVSGTGTFTVNAFSVNVEASDKIAVIHESLVMIGRDDAANNVITNAVVANANGSLLERAEFIQAAVADAQADIGDPSARANFKSLETMIGVPDAVNSNLDDLIRTGYDSTAITANANGSVIEQLKFLQSNIVPDLSGLVFRGQCDAAMGASATIIACAGLAGYGEDLFNTKYYMQVIKNANVPGAAPESEIRQITNYVSATGTFTTNAFSNVVEAADDIMIIHESLISGTSSLGTLVNTINTNVNTINTNVGDASGDTLTSIAAKLGDGATTVTADLTGLATDIGDPSGDALISLTAKIGDSANTVSGQVDKLDMVTLAVAPTAGSLATFIASGGVGLGTALDNSKSIVDAIGSDGTTVAVNTTSVGGQVLLAKAEALKIDSATLAVSPTAGSLARFVASGGTALGTPLADSKSLINAIGTDGTTAAAATAASAASLFGAIGTNEADVTTPFTSDAVEANADGTILEREEYIQQALSTLATFSAARNGLVYRGICDAGMAPSTATIVIPSLAGYGEDLFNTKYYMQVIKNANVPGAAPESEIQPIIGYVSTTGTFVVFPGYTVNVEAGDTMMVLHESLVSKSGTAGTFLSAGENISKIDATSLVAAPAPGSLASFVASGGVALGTGLAASKSIIDAIGSNGTTLVYGSGSALGAIGTVFWIKKTMVSSDIVSGAPVDITGVSSAGELAIEDVVVKTDGTGLAGGTNFELKSNNAKGQLNFFVETVANLGASVTVDNSDASVLGEHTVLESGKKLQVQATVGDCTGAGTIDIYVKLRRLAAGAIVAAL